MIVGGGPAGLTAAANLAGRVDGPVLVIEREAAAEGSLGTATISATASATCTASSPGRRMRDG